MKHYTMLPRGVSLLLTLLCAMGISAQTYMQFWFDSDKTVKKADIPASGTLKGKIDVQQLQQGFHTIYMRVRTPGAEYEYSPITMSTFIKFATGEGAKLQYWFDDDADNFSTIDVDAESGKAQTLMLDLSNIERFPLGVHQLNMRVAHNGGRYSPIYSAYTLRLPAGSDNSVLQYWFDDDVDNLSTIEVSTGLDEPQLLMLDLSNIERFPLGVHQLNMRVAQNGVNFSPVYSAYVLRLPAGTSDSMLEYWFDDNYENHATIAVSTDKDGIQKLDLDLSDQSKFPYGLHRLNMRVASLGSQFSPVYSAIVMRRIDGYYNTIDYWLDDDYANRRHLRTTELDASTSHFTYKLDFSSAALGMHRLHYRISAPNLDDGPIYEVPILITRLYNNTLTDVTILNQSNWMDDADVKSSVVANPMSILTLKYSLTPSLYAEGQHAFHIQFQNSAGVWSAQNITYFYKDASGKLRAGLVTPEDDITAINENAGAEQFTCYYRSGTIVVDCQSSKLAPTGVVVVCDLTGRVVAREEVDCSNGLHAELSVNSTGRQMLIVKVLSGDVHYNKKLITK